MRALLFLFALLLAVPGALAQADHPRPDTPMPSTTTGNDGGAPVENVEDEAGISYYVFLLLGALAVGGSIFLLLRRQDREERRAGRKR